MGLIGTYSCAQLGAKLEIKEANNANGQGSGTFTMGGVSLPVAIHYHFKDNVGPTTVFQVWTSDTYGWQYIGAAGCSSDTSASAGIYLAGGISTLNSATGFAGLFVK